MLWLLACSRAPDSTPAPPVPTAALAPPGNVLIVLLDDVSADRLGTYGLRPDAAPTPTLDGLAAQGVLFRNAWGTPLCSSARASLLTGRYPSRHGLGHVMEVVELESLSPQEVSLPEMLTSSPWAWSTSQIGKWHLASYDGHEDHPRRQGFDWFAGSRGNLWGLTGDPDLTYWNWEKNDNGTIAMVTDYATTDATDDAIARVQEMAEPWLLYLGAYAAHSPYHVPPTELVQGDFPTPESQFLAMITSLDAELGRLLGAMDPEVREHTTIVVVGDNGDPWDLAGSEQEDLDYSGRVKGGVYERGVRVPFLVSGPQVGRPGSVSDALVSLVDLFPTVAELARVDLGALEHPIDGVSLMPVLQDPQRSVRETVYTEAFYTEGTLAGVVSHETWALRDARYKLLVRDNWNYYSELPPDGVELYDLQADPGELVDLAGSAAHAAELERLQGLAAELRASFPEG
jgi:arylsulfatase A-like enzyme